MEPKLGAPQYCPVCGGNNPSGLRLPEQCVWCKKKRENIAWLKKEAELHELAMQQNKDRMQDLEEENATLHQRNAELTDAFTALMEGLEMENIERALKASPEILKTVGCKIAEAAKRNKKDRKG